MLKVYSFIILLSTFFLDISAASSQTSEQTKRYTKSYTLSGNEVVNIKNSFGNVTVNHWNNKEVKVDATISVKTNNTSYTRELLDGITIEDNRGSEISFKTKIDQKSSKGKSNNISMRINYQVFLPPTTRLKIANSFGNTTIADHAGSTELNQSYGNLTTGNLKNADRISVEFGSLAAKQLENVRADIKYSKVTIGKVSGNVKINLEFCKKPLLEIAPAIQQLNIDAKYSDVTLVLPGSIDAAFDIKTSFGGVVNNSDVKLNSGDNKRFNETHHSKSSTNSNKKITIHTEFGKVTLDNK